MTKPNLYVGKGDGTYAPVSVERRWNRNARQYEYTYTWEGQDAPFVSSGSNAAPNLPAGAALYVYRSGGSISRAEALKTAAHGFVDAVKKNAVGADGVAGTDDDVAHRVAVVGFANGSIQDDWAFSGDSYHNTGLFDGGSLTLYNNIGADQYASALKDMSADEGSANVKASIDALQADGGTYIDYGLAMAQSVFDGAFVAQGEERDRVVVVLTDGSPGTRGSDEGVANRAIAAAAGLKGSGATVYSVGIFPNAIASGSLPVYSRSWNDDMSNRFMHLLSSNYPSAASMTSSGDRFVDVEGAMPDFYFAASDAAGLEAVFRAIAQESGGSSIQLDDEAFVKDVMAPGFALAPGTDASGIEVFTQAYRGDGPDGDPCGRADAVDGSGYRGGRLHGDRERVRLRGQLGRQGERGHVRGNRPRKQACGAHTGGADGDIRRHGVRECRRNGGVPGRGHQGEGIPTSRRRCPDRLSGGRVGRCRVAWRGGSACRQP